MPKGGRRGRHAGGSASETAPARTLRGVPPEVYYIHELLALHPQLTSQQAEALVMEGLYPEPSDSDDCIMGPSALDIRIAQYIAQNKRT